MHNIKTAVELIKKAYIYDYPIKGGSGKSYNDAIIIDIIAWSIFVRIEYEIVNFLAIHIGKILKVRQQKLRKQNDKIYDILSIEEVSPDKDKYTIDIYFDVTDCWNKKNKK